MLTPYLAIFRAIEFVGVPFLAAMVIAVLTSLIYGVIGPSDYRASYKLALACRLSIAFSAYAFLLGIFVGMTGDLLITTVVGTVTTLATTYIALLNAKSAADDDQKALAPALVAFFLNMLLMIDYVLQYHSALVGLVKATSATGH